VYAVAACGLHLILNDAGQISLAHGTVVAVGAFAGAHVFGTGGLPLALVAGGCAGAVVGALVSLPALRLHGFIVAVTTWLFAIAVDRFLFTQPWFVGEAGGLAVADASFLGVRLGSARAELVAAAVIALIATCVTVSIRSSRFGRSLLAVRSNETMAASVGIDVRRAKIVVFVIGGAFAGVAGALWVLLVGRAVPSSFPPLLSVTFLAVAVIGGRGSLAGPIAAAFMFATGPQLFGWLGRVLLYASSLLLIVVLVQFPGGLNEQARHVRHLVARRRA
jgi:branched-chain amino acid transport system permease protein